jgi:hypothetical protein
MQEACIDLLHVLQKSLLYRNKTYTVSNYCGIKIVAKPSTASNLMGEVPPRWRQYVAPKLRNHLLEPTTLKPTNSMNGMNTISYKGIVNAQILTWLKSITKKGSFYRKQCDEERHVTLYPSICVPRGRCSGEKTLYRSRVGSLLSSRNNGPQETS